jgi:hypothetical protein
MALGDLKKRATERQKSGVEDGFINGADERANQHAVKSERKIKSYLFGLTQEANEAVEAMALRSRSNRLSRSDVIRLGVLALSSMQDSDFDKLVEIYFDGKNI